jgi:hypothetical protein
VTSSEERIKKLKELKIAQSLKMNPSNFTNAILSETDPERKGMLYYEQEREYVRVKKDKAIGTIFSAAMTRCDVGTNNENERNECNLGALTASDDHRKEIESKRTRSTRRSQ